MLETIFLSLILYFNFNFINNSSYKIISEREEFLKKVSTKLLSIPVSIYDIATIDNILQSMLEHQNVREIKIYDNSNLLLSSVGDVTNYKDAKKLDVPLVLENMKIGNLVIWLDFLNDYGIISSHKERLFIIVFWNW